MASYDGRFGPQNYEETSRMFGLAAEQGCEEAQYNLGSMHCHGEGGPQNYAEAMGSLTCKNR